MIVDFMIVDFMIIESMVVEFMIIEFRIVEFMIIEFMILGFVPGVMLRNCIDRFCTILAVVLSNSVLDSGKGKNSAIFVFLEENTRMELQYDFRHYRHCEPSVTRKLA